MRAQSKTVLSNEIEPKPRRRRFTAEYKATILAQATACTVDGEIGALLRREGLYSSHLHSWRAQARAGTLEALASKRGPKKRSEADLRAEKLERKVQQLEAKLKYAEEVIEVQKKLSQILGIQLNPPKEPEFDVD
jgi:transposase